MWQERRGARLDSSALVWSRGSRGRWSLVETEEYLAALQREGRVLGDAAERAGLQAPVPSCPGWTVADLVWHIGEVHHFWGGVVQRRATEHTEVPKPARPADADLLAWYREGLERLADVLAAADPATAVWTWAPQKDVAFIQRRMAQETVVHRVDAELAAGAPTPIDPRLAVDGVDEFFRFCTAWKREGGRRWAARCACTPPTPTGSGWSPRPAMGCRSPAATPRAMPPPVASPATCSCCCGGGAVTVTSRCTATPPCSTASSPAPTWTRRRDVHGLGRLPRLPRVHVAETSCSRSGEAVQPPQRVNAGNQSCRAGTP